MKQISPNACWSLCLVGFAICAWRANDRLCPDGSLSDIVFRLSDGTPIYARVYEPTNVLGPLAAVIVAHGYLANRPFMEIPWASDLVGLGAVALFLDRRGHGESGGSLWPPQASDPGEDIAAAVAYLRSRVDRVDPSRIALFGHSDGASAALLAGAGDWDVAATIAVSASVADVDLVNRFAPQNLFLIYGGDDYFVVRDTDKALIMRSTRGYLAGAGRFGSLEDGSARRLMTVEGEGHVSVIFKDTVRREILGWLATALRSEGHPRPSSCRFGWMAAGLFFLTAGGWTFGLTLRSPPSSHHLHLARVALLAVVWTVGLCLSPLVANALGWIPGQEAPVFAGLMLAPLACLSVGGLLINTRVRRAQRSKRSYAEGAAASTVVFVAFNLLLKHHYEMLPSSSRLPIFAAVCCTSVPAFFVLGRWLDWAAPSLMSRACTLCFLAFLCVILSPALFARMATVPLYLVAVVLVLLAAFGEGSRRFDATFGGLTVGWIAMFVCALY